MRVNSNILQEKRSFVLGSAFRVFIKYIIPILIFNISHLVYKDNEKKFSLTKCYKI